MNSGRSDLVRLSSSAPLQAYTVSPPPSFTGSLWDIVHSALESFRQQDWDGDGAEPVAVEAVSQASEFVGALPFGTTPPHVSVGYDGSIGLAWQAPGFNMFAHFPARGVMDFTYELNRFGWRHSKRMSVNNSELLDEIRPTFGYIRQEISVVFVSVTFTYVTQRTYITGWEPNAGTK
jgi:hypothetical protein